MSRNYLTTAGSPWEHAHLAPSKGKLKDELLAREVLDTLLEAKVLVARWRRHYSQMPPDTSLGHRPPAPDAILLRERSPELASMWAVDLRL